MSGESSAPPARPGWPTGSSLDRRRGRPKAAAPRRWDELEPDGAGATLVHTTVAFDILSLGWLVKVFLRHHPEIRFGTMAGCPLTLLDALRRSVEVGAQSLP